MNFNGIIIGAAVFLSIGICHPLVINSLLIENDILSIIIGGFAFCFLWGIHEMFLQEKRVLRGWFPENPKRHEYYEAHRRLLHLK